ncbi:hypothetical protein FLACHUCJ7_02756 [Flavobacterium chungangense]|uniref:Uncharacterized protein n=1 Tax=Flavobacterium chungangense TaxID=554283 RepID=A0A6V6Z3P1_9FLAO|nr:hypothetical protein FLACHUCJ7_02756 [Flavobacterium chungangense]
MGFTVYPLSLKSSIIPSFPARCAAPTAENKLPVLAIESILLVMILLRFTISASWAFFENINL